MFFATCYIAFFLCLASSGSAFKLSFFDNGNCGGEFAGTWIGGEGQGCRTDFVGSAEGVVIESTGAVDDNTQVQFYTSNDCKPGTEISQGNVGCIAVDNELVGSYGSFNVIADIPVASAGKTRQSTGERRDQVRRASITPHIAQQPSITHGQFGTFDGIEYRWQQVHATGWIGILPLEWDDNIHTKNDSIPADSYNGTSLAIRDLDERNLLQGICQVGVGCLQAASAGAVTVGQVAAATWASAQNAAIAAGTNTLDYLNRQPFITTVFGGFVAGVPAAIVATKFTGNSKNVVQCSDLAAQNDLLKTQIDLLNSIVTALQATKTASAVTIVLQNNDAGDEVSSVTLAVTGCGSSPKGDGCGLTTGFCVGS